MSNDDEPQDLEITGITPKGKTFLLTLNIYFAARERLEGKKGPLKELPEVDIDVFGSVVDRVLREIGEWNHCTSNIVHWDTVERLLSSTALLAVATGIAQPERWAAEALRLIDVERNRLHDLHEPREQRITYFPCADELKRIGRSDAE